MNRNMPVNDMFMFAHDSEIIQDSVADCFIVPQFVIVSLYFFVWLLFCYEIPFEGSHF